jgi:hypothetical protein
MIFHLHDPLNELQRLTSPSLLMLGVVELVNRVETNKMKKVEADVAWIWNYGTATIGRRDATIVNVSLPSHNTLPKVYKIYHRNVWKNTYVQERFCPLSLQAVELSV